MADDADDQTSYRFLEVYLFWLFGWVLFCESLGDSVSRCMIPWAQRIADAPLEQMPQISWGSAVLAASYRGLCSAVTRPTSREAILLGCPLLLQMWIHERFDIGRPLGVRGDGQRHRPSGPPHHGFSVVSPKGNDLPLRDSSRYDFCSSIHLTCLVLCNTFGLGSSRRRPTRTSLVRSTGWSMPRSGGRRTLLPSSLPAHHRGSRPCAPETRPTG
jgi:hypothetical protein